MKSNVFCAGLNREFSRQSQYSWEFTMFEFIGFRDLVEMR